MYQGNAAFSLTKTIKRIKQETIITKMSTGKAKCKMPALVSPNTCLTTLVVHYYSLAHYNSNIPIISSDPWTPLVVLILVRAIFKAACKAILVWQSEQLQSLAWLFMHWRPGRQGWQGGLNLVVLWTTRPNKKTKIFLPTLQFRAPSSNSNININISSTCWTIVTFLSLDSCFQNIVSDQHHKGRI